MPLARYWSFAFALAVTLLVMFFAASSTGIALLEDPRPLFGGGRLLAAVAGVALLVADVFLPVPSSLVMTAHGALFGVAGGALLSLLGGTLSALAGFLIGRAGNGVIRRIVTPDEHERAGRLLGRWGLVAIAVTRPIPILAETVAILAGSSQLSWRHTTLAAAAGSLVPSLVYAWAGAHARDAGSHALIFGGVLAVTAVLLFAGQAVKAKG